MEKVDVITESSMSEEFAQEVMRDRVLIYKRIEKFSKDE